MPRRSRTLPPGSTILQRQCRWSVCSSGSITQLCRTTAAQHRHAGQHTHCIRRRHIALRHGCVAGAVLGYGLQANACTSYMAMILAGTGFLCCWLQEGTGVYLHVYNPTWAEGCIPLTLVVPQHCAGQHKVPAGPQVTGWCGVVWCGMVRCGVVRCGVVVKIDGPQPAPQVRGDKHALGSYAGINRIKTMARCKT